VKTLAPLDRRFLATRAAPTQQLARWSLLEKDIKATLKLTTLIMRLIIEKKKIFFLKYYQLVGHFILLKIARRAKLKARSEASRQK
jgi:TRAP-type mannitol/chloroaromatic compound transport system permease large subunit